MLVDAMKQHLEEKILNPICRKLTLRPKRPIVLKNKLWTLLYETRPVRANSESALVKAKGSKTERHGQQA